VSKLSGHGMALGLFEEALYTSTSLDVPEDASLLLYSDGIYEVPRQDGSIGTLNDFLQAVDACRPQLVGEDGLDALVERSAGTSFPDDYALLMLQFPGTRQAES
jgi:sigma-B regulation protein RsbU (phosphoserine phosphatase)